MIQLFSKTQVVEGLVNDAVLASKAMDAANACHDKERARRAFRTYQNAVETASLLGVSAEFWGAVNAAGLTS